MTAKKVRVSAEATKKLAMKLVRTVDANGAMWVAEMARALDMPRSKILWALDYVDRNELMQHEYIGRSKVYTLNALSEKLVFSSKQDDLHTEFLR